RAVRGASVYPRTLLLLGGQPPAEQTPQTDVDVPAPSTEVAPTTAAAADEGDPHSAISEVSRAGRHGEAAAIAASYEQAALRERGAQSVEVAHWIEVRAFLALQEGAHDRACQLWLQAAVVRLTADQPPSHPEGAEAVDRAHAAQHRVSDPALAREVATELLSLRTRFPGKR